MTTGPVLALMLALAALAVALGLRTGAARRPARIRVTADARRGAPRRGMR